MKYYPLLLLMYLHLFEIAVCLSLRAIEEQTELQFAFRYKMKWNNIIQVTNCRRIILIFSL